MGTQIQIIFLTDLKLKFELSWVFFKPLSESAPSPGLQCPLPVSPTSLTFWMCDLFIWPIYLSNSLNVSIDLKPHSFEKYYFHSKYLPNPGIHCVSTTTKKSAYEYNRIVLHF